MNRASKLMCLIDWSAHAQIIRGDEVTMTLRDLPKFGYLETVSKRVSQN